MEQIITVPTKSIHHAGLFAIIHEKLLPLVVIKVQSTLTKAVTVDKETRLTGVSRAGWPRTFARCTHSMLVTILKRIANDSSLM